MSAEVFDLDLVNYGGLVARASVVQLLIRHGSQPLLHPKAIMRWR